MIHQILTLLDKNSENGTPAVLAQFIDWSQAFDRQCPTMALQSFIDNGVRKSLIPVLADYFTNRKMVIKFNRMESEAKQSLCWFMDSRRAGVQGTKSC